jgi:Lrp/AsnC family leucine-responsive transcriptional regulator
MENSTIRFENNGGLDALDWALLEALQENARLSFSELGRRVNLSQPAVAERVKKLEKAGIIVGYRACVDYGRLGLPIFATIGLTLSGAEEQFLERLKEISAIYECLTVTGEDCYQLRARLPSIEALERLMKTLGRYGKTNTSIVLSTPLQRHTVTKTHLV